jgi:hypothetical protein
LNLSQSLVLLVLNVTLDHGQWRTADRGNKIAVRPERRQSGFDALELLAQNPRCLAFDLLDQPVDSVLRVYLDQEMHVIRLDLQLNDFGLVLYGVLMDQFLEPVGDSTDQYLSPIFRAPDYVVFA